jgi:hypothetical protein
METEHPREDATRAIQRTRRKMVGAVTRPLRAVALGLDISLPLAGGALRGVRWLPGLRPRAPR